MSFGHDAIRPAAARRRGSLTKIMYMLKWMVSRVIFSNIEYYSVILSDIEYCTVMLSNIEYCTVILSTIE